MANIIFELPAALLKVTRVGKATFVFVPQRTAAGLLELKTCQHCLKTSRGIKGNENQTRAHKVTLPPLLSDSFNYILHPKTPSCFAYAEEKPKSRQITLDKQNNAAGERWQRDCDFREISLRCSRSSSRLNQHNSITISHKWEYEYSMRRAQAKITSRLHPVINKRLRTWCKNTTNNDSVAVLEFHLTLRGFSKEEPCRYLHLKVRKLC